MDKPKIVDYLYELENSIYRPTTDWTKMNNVASERSELIDWMYNTAKKFEMNELTFYSGVSILDAYMSLVNIHKKEFQKIGWISLYIAETFNQLEIDDIGEYIHIASGVYSTEELIAVKNNILLKLGGRIVKPITLYFAGDFINKDLGTNLVYISLFSSSLMVYKPSVIADAINYMMSGKVLKYSINDVQYICAIIVNLVKRGVISSLKNLRKKCISVSPQLILRCPNIYNAPHIYQASLETSLKLMIGVEKISYIGNGAQGDVFKIKLRDNFYAQKNGGEFFVGELAILKLFRDHKYIVNLEGFLPSKDPNEDSSFLFFELGAINLRSFIKENSSLKESDILGIFKDILKGIDKCYYYDIIHGDIKPDNIVWYPRGVNRENGGFKLIDFGLSQCLATFKSVLPYKIGTPIYTAPEVFFSSGHYNHKIDVWAAGVCLFYIATGKEFLDPLDFSEREVLLNLFSRVGTPTEKNWPGVTSLPDWSNRGYPSHIYDDEWFNQQISYVHINSILKKCFILDPQNRPSAEYLLHCLK